MRRRSRRTRTSRIPTMPIHAIRASLSDERKPKFDEMIARNEESVLCFKLLRKDYTAIKSNIKKIEKRRLKMMEEMPDGHQSNSIKREISSIEKKYVGIEKAIKYYKETQRNFARSLKTSYSGFSSNFESSIQHLDYYSASANSHIAAAYDCIRITKRYFNNITSYSEHHIRMLKYKKDREQMINHEI